MTALDDDEIRLLRISKPEGTATLHYSTKQKLRISDFLGKEPCSYIAVSYVWGTDRVSLHCDEQDVVVPKSLAEALSAIYEHYTDILVWTDCLCIDQDDANEKSRQVSLMGSIYSMAGEVVIWLGADLENICEGLTEVVIWSDTTTELMFLTSDSERRRSLLRQIAALPWFYRAWCYQEIRLAAHATVVFESKSMPWLTFIKAINCLLELEPNFSSVAVRSKPRTLSRFVHKDEDRFFASLNELYTSKPLDLSSSLLLTWYRESTEQCDKVYSVLSTVHVPPQDNGKIPIDYGIEWNALCIKTARYCINTSFRITNQKSPGLKILRIAGMIERWKHPSNGFWDCNEAFTLLRQPSWAPDWWRPPQRSRSHRSLEYDERGVFSALDFCCSKISPRQDLDDDSPFLSLKGVLLGIVQVDSVLGRTQVHSPPRCAGTGYGSLTSSGDENQGLQPMHISQVDMSSFSRAVASHMDGSCSCALFRQQAHLSTYQHPDAVHGVPAERFDSGFSFSVHDFARPPDETETTYPAQVLAASVESGDWLVLLEGGGMPFLLRSLRNSSGRLSQVHELAGLAHANRLLSHDAGMFVLVGEASMCWDKLWPCQWEIYCRQENFVII